MAQIAKIKEKFLNKFPFQHYKSVSVTMMLY